MSSDMKKKCSGCKEYKPLNKDNFTLSYRKSVDGSYLSQWKSKCKPCMRQYYHDNSHRWVKKTTKDMSDEDKKRQSEINRARIDARKRLSKIYSKDFHLLYEQELLKRGLSPDLKLLNYRKA